MELPAIDGRTGSLSQRVHWSLQEAILTLALPPGAVLRKKVVCDQLSVSRGPVSEAIARLSTEGLVDVVPQSITRVTYLSLPEIREAAFIREALELAAIEIVASNRTDEQVKWLKRSIRMQALLIEDKDFYGFHKADEDFHAHLLQYTGLPRLSQLCATVSLQVTRARRLLLPTPGRVSDTVTEHAAIVAAIDAQDPSEARSAMRDHLRQLIKRVAPLKDTRPELFDDG